MKNASISLQDKRVFCQSFSEVFSASEEFDGNLGIFRKNLRKLSSGEPKSPMKGK